MVVDGRYSTYLVWTNELRHRRTNEDLSRRECFFEFQVTTWCGENVYKMCFTFNVLGHSKTQEMDFIPAGGMKLYGLEVSMCRLVSLLPFFLSHHLRVPPSCPFESLLPVFQAKLLRTVYNEKWTNFITFQFG